MKIFNTKTQREYDLLMAELGERGIETLAKSMWLATKIRNYWR